jgi:protein-disulfide isomerase
MVFVTIPCRAGDGEDDVIATLNGAPILQSEVERNVAFKIYRLRGSIYHLLKTEAEELADQKLLEQEANRRGLTVERLLKKEVDQKVSPVEEEDIDAYLAEQGQEAVKEPSKRYRVRTYLYERARIQRQLDLLASLRQKADFQFLLKPPEPPRTNIDTTGEPWRGNREAPVTLVHFASFTCRLCPESALKIGKIMVDFPGKIKWVHRNFLSVYDEKALAAAQLGEAAHGQGKFWAFHDRVFSFNGHFKMKDLEVVGKHLGLNREDVGKGEQEGRFLMDVKEDINEARKRGVTGAPAIFVNGLYFSGTFPYDELKALVRKELDRVEKKEKGP